ncbi:MAG TPA: class I SAM-dependent methyltransferase, partial [Gemmatimonadaceae bacterium]|nr:class I SAM-dependent methyltransferase [Gemmatimonadaceae bacterium]
PALESPRQQTLASFDWQWSHLPSGDFMPGDPWFDANATRVLTNELCAIDPRWFAGKRVLDAGCGRGRWTRSLLELGAEVTAVDFSEAALARTAEIGANDARLRARRVDLLDLPADIGDFDLVFSFGVLHHTGDTWRALENVARLVRPSGALVLYLYGSGSWTPDETDRIDRLRLELAQLAFADKIVELQRRFPGDDPHQLFDLLSPVINDRVSFPDVRDRLTTLGFTSVQSTISHSEIYLRATRHAFEMDSLLPPVGVNSSFVVESTDRGNVRRGVTFETSLRRALTDIASREQLPAVTSAIGTAAGAGRVLDLSLPPDRLSGNEIDPRAVVVPFAECPLGVEAETRRPTGDCVVFLGAAIGACRFPERMLRHAFAMVRPGGYLVIDFASSTPRTAHRTLVDRIRDRRLDVPGKMRALLTRHPDWCSGEALAALGGARLLNPLSVERVREILSTAGALHIAFSHCGPSRDLVTARSAS